LIDFVVKHLREDPTKLNDAQLAARLHMSNELLRLVHLDEHENWQYFMTRDE
jgi:hypothetical protein